MPDVPMLRFGDRDDWTDKWDDNHLPMIRREHAAEASTARGLLGDDLFDQVSVASTLERAELRVEQADEALRERGS